jgi:putative membrane protein insertion efficiency factor
MKNFLVKAIRFYQRRISPLFPPKCRYYPTCSQYALQAIEIHGVFKGMLLAIGRLMRCNIFFPGGVDPVPPKKEKK